jgi:phenylacetic acid degradation operon negative regulatory protein
VPPDTAPPPDTPGARFPAAPAVARWLRRELATRPPRAQSLIVTVWGDALAPHGGEAWLATLFALVAPLGINERLVRTSVFRLAQDGWLAAESVGRRSRYRLTAVGAHRFTQAYRRVYTPPFHPWDGSWDVLVVPADALPAARRRALRDDLAWNGYAAFAPGVYARPADATVDLDADVDGAERIVRFSGRDLPGATARTLASRVDEAWALGSVAAEYLAFLARFSNVVAAFHATPPPAPEQAFLVRTLLVHEYRRVRLRDPQLPPALLPADWPGGAAYALCRDFYRAASPLAEAHLAAVVAEAGERLKPALPEFFTRFADAQPAPRRR